MRPTSTFAGNEQGSAYVVTLLVLLVLSILGLSLALITRTERQVGANERTLNRTLYAADAGIGVAAAEALTSGNYMAPPFLFNHRRVLGNLDVADQVTVTRFVVISYGPCNWCPMNEDAGNPPFQRYDHAINSTARRVIWNGTQPAPPAGARVQARKTLGEMLSFEPWVTDTEAALKQGEEGSIRF